MATDGDPEHTPLTPDAAFAVLGNETRMEILQTLADADEALSFSELRDRVGVSDSGQFNYHLDKLVGHFLEDTDEGYGLRRAGERIIEAVVSGAVTESPVIEPTVIEWPCPLCEAPVELTYQQEWVALSCTECSGLYGGSIVVGESAPPEQLEHGYLGGLSLPPAAIQGRSPAEVLRTAWTWDVLERMATSAGICPRCSAPVEQFVDVCDEHDASSGICEECGSQREINHEVTCANCHYHQVGLFPVALNANTDLLEFITAHGYNPITPSADLLREMAGYEEELLSIEPFEARFTWTFDGDALTLTVDDDLNVVDVARERATNPDR